MTTIIGTVTDRTTGQGLDSSQIRTNTGMTLKTGDDGRFSLEGVPLGTVKIKVSKKGFDGDEKTILVQDDDTLTVNFSLRRGGGDSGGWVETIKTVVYAVLIAVAIRTVAYEPFNIPSGSMIPTLLVGDYLFVSKLSYGYSRYSLPFSLPLFSGRIFMTPPKRGDVAVFKLPADTSKDYIKRIIGLPGDHIQMRRGRLYINGRMVQRRKIENYVYKPDYSQRIITVPQYIETLPNGVSHPILEAMGDFGPLDNTREFIVPKGHYFGMGDNRDNSLDSRTTEVGFIPAENLVGRAVILFFSISGDVSWWQIWKWPGAIRYNRLLKTVG